ncbi:MAG: CoA pyrophosphatase [Ignavibacteriaceae bacterium]|nr:CoA pyrophosphatase [Ignavibacterium sp.]MCC6256570.1 CoA pyrophosphatase [Ignavibacteriaceae bacterium]HRN25725.1 CoA pyrophosphatase [Ignavibacteriaceae bacterium]HRP93663.1 CoA pyrophosphatase [Ignavibacteriaceae bacterium]HRQ53998.1 CoA pyrophosphatase [Ignavibacteriaceae bacterium]
MDYINTIKNLLTNDCEIIGKEKYLNSAVLIPIFVEDGNEFILFQKRSINVRQPGEVSFPGGHFESNKDKDFLSTAVRETCEELGIKESQITLLGKFGTLVAPMDVLIEAYIGILNVKSLDDLEIDKKEVERIFLIPLDFFLDNKPDEYYTNIEIHPFTIDENGNKIDHFPVKQLGLPEQYAIPWKRGKHRVLVYKTSEEIIWGITAELIFELSQKMKVQVDK